MIVDDPFVPTVDLLMSFCSCVKLLKSIRGQCHIIYPHSHLLTSMNMYNTEFTPFQHVKSPFSYGFPMLFLCFSYGLPMVC